MFRLTILIFCIIVLMLSAVVGLGAGRAKARDEQRIADINQISKALEAYKSNNLKYPDTANMLPKDINDYIEWWPQAPTPADGTCTKETNAYRYEQLDGGDSYYLSFCIGGDTKGFKAGAFRITP